MAFYFDIYKQSPIEVLTYSYNIIEFFKILSTNILAFTLTNWLYSFCWSRIKKGIFFFLIQLLVWNRKYPIIAFTSFLRAENKDRLSAAPHKCLETEHMSILRGGQSAFSHSHDKIFIASVKTSFIEVFHRYEFIICLQILRYIYHYILI